MKKRHWFLDGLIGFVIASVILITYDSIFRDTGGPIFATSSPRSLVNMVDSFTIGGVPPASLAAVIRR